ncbi:charged multivesicular body protein 6-A-like [Dysidea avara]|uniref:charged multivesicular body protein 6-A-like n=1 Tax=Dysidea avara TaxID=196820 RepID=UPI003320F7B4
MGGWFSRRSHATNNTNQQTPVQQSRVTPQDRAVLDLKTQRDRLKKYQKKIVGQLQNERKLAKQLLQDGKKEKAKLLLKKKHYLEGLLDKTDTQLDNLEQMVENIEFTQVEMKVVEGLKQGNECLEQMHKMMSLEDVERIMADTQESIEYQREIDELLGQNLSPADEEAVLQELDELLSGEDNIGERLPEVPTTEPVSVEEEQLPTAVTQKKKTVVTT